MTLDVEALAKKVTQIDTVEASVIAIITALVKEITANKNSPQALEALASQLMIAAVSLAAAVASTPVANT